MSLDFYLEQPGGKCPTCGRDYDDTVSEVFWKNITHNLGSMWEEAGVYDALYMSEGHKAGSVVEVLSKGIALMEADPPRFEKHNAKNGWGLYKHALPWLIAVRDACAANPDAVIRVSK